MINGRWNWTMTRDDSPKVAVAMSGGVDSSLAAALLKRDGYDVAGFMLKTWKDERPAGGNSLADPIESARSVAKTLGIPFEVIDIQAEFRENVVNSFIKDYQNGLTPSPCVFCNRAIKWKAMLAAADRIGARFVATGHYARVTRDAEGLFELRTGKDGSKDQAYMLCMLTQAELSRTMFPLGEYTKHRVREMAQEFELPTATQEDSQDLCFLPDGDYRGFLLRYSPEARKPGKIVDRQGNQLGEHEGLAFYTIGQRKGLGIYRPEPLYVLEKNLERNEVVVGTLTELGQQVMAVEAVNWISGRALDDGSMVDVKIRYKAKPVKGKIAVTGKTAVTVEFGTPMRDITPGQIAVFYDDDRVLGGGVIALGG